MQTLADKDKETRASVAIQTFLAKLEASESRKFWNYMVKNLVILDRAIDERLCLDEISKMNLPGVEGYTVPDKKDSKSKMKKINGIEARLIEELIRSYYGYIKTKARIMERSRCPFHKEKKDKKVYFQGKNVITILSEIETLNEITEKAFVVRY